MSRTMRLALLSLAGLAMAAAVSGPPIAAAGPASPSLPLATGWRPYDPAPELQFPTSDGMIALGAGRTTDSDYILIAREPLSGVSSALWAADPRWLLTSGARDVHYLFASYARTPEAVASDVAAMKAKVDAALAALPAADRAHWSGRVHYVVVDPLSVTGGTADLLALWGDTFPDVSARWEENGMPGGLDTRGTADSGWARPLSETGPITGPLAAYGNLACGQEAPTSPITGTVALVERGTCPFLEKVANAYRHGAIAALIYTTPDRELITMGGTCTECPRIPVAMVDSGTGLALRDKLTAGVAVTVTLRPAKGGAEMLAVDRRGRLHAFGSIPFPFNSNLGQYAIDPMRSVAWEARYLAYEHERDTRLAAEEAGGGVRVVPVFTDEWLDDPGWSGKRGYAEVDLPDATAMAGYDTLEMDLSLSCKDHWRDNCPAWDYIANLYLCRGDGAETCDVEVGRWITPYWSEGRWITDVSSLLALFPEGGRRKFAFYTQQRYEVDLSFRLSNRGKGLVPRLAQRLHYDGGAFWRDYNLRNHPAQVFIPEWARRVEFVGTISGHGFGHDTENCAEFCNHTHHVRLEGGAWHDKVHPETEGDASLLGCAEQVDRGVTPNQGGTWIYGRAGWCPGLEVRPWVVDLTADAKPGRWNELQYRGLFGGKDYVAVKGPDQDPGFDARIDMRSFVVYWSAPGAPAGEVPPPYPRIATVLLLPRAVRGEIP